MRTGIFRSGDRCVFRRLSVLFWVSCVFRRVFVVIKVGFCPDLDFYVVLLGKKSFEAIMGGERVGKRSKSFTTIRSSKGVIIVGGIMH